MPGLTYIENNQLLNSGSFFTSSGNITVTPNAAELGSTISIGVTGGYKIPTVGQVALIGSQSMYATQSLYATSSISASYSISSSWTYMAVTASYSNYYNVTIYHESSSFASQSISASYAPVEPAYSASVSTQFETKQNTLTNTLYVLTASLATSASYYPPSGSWASASISASYAPVEPAYSSSASSLIETKQPLLVTGNTYTITSSWAVNATTAGIANNISFVPTTATSASWVSASSFIITAQTASYVSSSNIIGLVTALSSSWASASLSSSYPWFTTGSNIAYVGGNVTIGSDSLPTVLDVTGTTKIRGLNALYFGQTLSGYICYGNGVFVNGANAANDLGIMAAHNFGISANNSSTPMILLNTSGNVGIGTITPTNKLDVAGNISCSVITASLLLGTASWASQSLNSLNVNGLTIISTPTDPTFTASYTVTAKGVPLISNESHTHILVKANGKIFGAGWDGNLFRIDDPDGDFLSITTSSFGGPTYIADGVYSSTTGYLYFCTSTNIFQVDPVTLAVSTSFTYAGGTPSNLPTMRIYGDYVYLAPYASAPISFLKINIHDFSAVTSSALPWTSASVDLGSCHASAITPDGQYWFVTNAGGHIAKVKTSDMTWSTITVYDPITSVPLSYTVDCCIFGNSFYATTEGNIYVSKTDINTLSTEVELDNVNSFGIWTDGYNVYMGCNTAGRVYVYPSGNISNGPIIFNLSGFGAASPNEMIWTDGGYPIITKWLTGEVWRYNPFPLLLVGIGKVPTTTLDVGGNINVDLGITTTTLSVTTLSASTNITTLNETLIGNLAMGSNATIIAGFGLGGKTYITTGSIRSNVLTSSLVNTNQITASDISLSGLMYGIASYALTASYISSSNVIGPSTALSSSWASASLSSSYPWFTTGSNIAYVGGNVGIGTQVPVQKLSVVSTGQGNKASFSELGDTIDVGHENYISVGGYNGTAAVPLVLGHHYVTGDGSSDYGYLELLGGTRAVAVKFNGNVGIGTTIPDSPLHIIRTSLFADPIAKFQGTGSDGSGILQLDRSSGGRMSGIRFTTTNTDDWFAGTYYNGSNQLNFGIGSDYQEANQKLVIQDTTGNVGIGTTTPISALTVKSTTTYPPSLGSMSSSVVNFTAGVGGVDLAMGYESGGLNAWWIQTRNNAADGYSYPLSLNPLGGNVGIGTTTPTVKLEIKTTSVTSVLPIVVLNSSISAVDAGMSIDFRNNITVSYARVAGVTNSAGAAGELAFYTSPSIYGTPPSEKMRIVGSGNVGIGTTIPSASLEVNGLSMGTSFLSTGGSSPSFGKGVMLRNGGLAGYDWGGAGGFQPIDLNGSYLTFTISDSEKMRIIANGNVGIGTTSPGKKFVVSGSAGAFQVDPSQTGTYNDLTPGVVIDTKYEDLNIGASMGIGTVGAKTALMYYNQSAYYSALEYSNVTSAFSNLLLMKSGGNVGIGMTTPTHKLDINNTGGNPVALNIGGNDPTNTCMALSNSLGATVYKLVGGIMGESENGFSIYDTTANASRFVILDNGNVGIGTTTPTLATLQINGNVYATSYTGSISGSVSGTATYALTASSADYFHVRNDITIDGVLMASQLSSSNIYITSSYLIATDNILQLNAQTPHLRYSGLELFDSGSSLQSAFFLWDGLNNYFFLSSSDGGWSRKIVMGPSNETDLTPNYLPLADSFNSLKDSVIYQSGSNVGIGTTSPSSKLSIQGAGSVTPFLDLTATSNGTSYVVSELKNTGGYGTFGLNNSSGGYFVNGLAYSTFLGTENATALQLVTNNSAAMTIANGGNVGIGTKNPSTHKLVVDSGVAGIAIGTTNYSYGGVGSALVIKTGGDTGDTYSSIYSVISGHTVYGNIAISPYGGNVGIGTTTPIKPLVVYRSTGSTSLGGSELLRLSTNNDNNVNGVRNEIGFGLTSFNPSALIGSVITNSGSFGYADFYIATRELTTDTAPIQRLTVKSNGNVGIGTTSPIRQMQINGVGQITANITDAGVKDAMLLISSTDGSDVGSGGAIAFSSLNGNGTQVPQWAIKSFYQDAGGNGRGDLVFSGRTATGDTALTEKVRIQSNGNVGIGTTTPVNKLDVAGNISCSVITASLINAATNIDTAGNGSLSFGQITYNSAGRMTFDNSAADPVVLTFATAGLVSATIDSGGNIITSGSITAFGGVIGTASYAYTASYVSSSNIIGIVTSASYYSATNYKCRITQSSGNINGSNFVFTWTPTPIAGTEMLFRNGILQMDQGNDYTIVGDTVTFVSAPLTGDRLLMTYFT